VGTGYSNAGRRWARQTARKDIIIKRGSLDKGRKHGISAEGEKTTSDKKQSSSVDIKEKNWHRRGEFICASKPEGEKPLKRQKKARRTNQTQVYNSQLAPQHRIKKRGSTYRGALYEREMGKKGIKKKGKKGVFIGPAKGFY